MLSDGHPVQFAVDYPDRPLNRLTTFFRVFTAIPIAIVLSSVSGGSTQFGTGSGRTVVASAGGVLFLGPAHDRLPPEVPALVV